MVKRYYVLTEDCLHRFARQGSDTFFGKEIAHYDLEYINNPRISKSSIHFSVVLDGHNGSERRIRCPTINSAEQWLAAITKAQNHLKVKRRDSLDGRERRGSNTNSGRKKYARRPSITGDYQAMMQNSPLQFGKVGGTGSHGKYISVYIIHLSIYKKKKEKKKKNLKLSPFSIF